jgi:hypothetical protein
MMGGECVGTVRASIKASALPLMQASAVRSIRSLRCRDAMHVYTRNKVALRQSVMQPGERKSVWDLVQALQRSKLQPKDRKMPDLWATRRAEIGRDVDMER